MRGHGVLAAACSAAIAVVSIAPARAQSTDVPAWIELLDKQPAGVDRPTWKEQRREAARKLAASGDKRAVAPLIKLADNEAFDAIGETAITGLGTLGDASAIPVLEKIAADASRDRNQRDLARKALAKLGAKPGAGTPTPPAPTPPTPTPPTPTPPAPPDPDVEPEPVVVSPTPPADLGGGLLGDQPSVPATSRWNDQVLATTEQLTFAIGAASLTYDTVRDRYAFDLDASSRYARRVEQAKTAWGFGAGARVIAGILNPEERAVSKATIVDLDGDGEFRAYGGPGLYGLGRGVVSAQLQYLSVVRVDPDDDNLKESRLAADVGIAIGGGYGRVLDVGPRLRVKQLEALLEKARALGRPIDDDLAARLQSAWWEARRDRTAYRQLTATVAILREAGVLLGEPDSGTTYALLEVLRDPSFDHRPSGVDVNLTFGEEYLRRPGEEDTPTEGRTELALVSATAARQLGLASDAVLRLDARYRILADEDVATPWRVSAGGTWRRFVHADHGELMGALDVHAELAATDDDREDTDLGLTVGGGAGWTWTLSRASSIRAGADARLDAGEVFFGASIAASYGFLDGAFARSAP